MFKLGRVCSRYISTNVAVDKKVLQKLRSETGLPFIKIKEALQENDYNPDKALTWLETHAAEQNWNKAQKLGQRATSQGQVGILKQSDLVSLVAVQCETESVSKNEHFIDLIHSIALSLGSMGKSGQISLEEVLNNVNNENVAFSEMFTSTIGRLGENIQAKGCYSFRLSPKMSSYHYLHRKTESEIPDLYLGSIGSSVIVDNLEDQVIGNMIAQHLVGSESLDNLLEQPLLQDESVTVGELCKQYNFRIIDYCKMSAQ